MRYGVPAKIQFFLKHLIERFGAPPYWEKTDGTGPAMRSKEFV
jgi:hypothetical protein